MATIAIVDDNPDNLKLVRAVLTRAGHRVTEFATGVGFAGRAATDPPDLVQLDLGLPDLDGFGVLAELRRLPRRLQVVALTAHASPEDQALARQAGFDAFISKPIDIATFPDQVRRLLPA